MVVREPRLGWGTAKGGVRVIGPNGRNQAYASAGDPTYRVNQQGRNVGGKGRGGSVGGGGKGQVTPRGGVMAGGVEGAAGAPLPVGVVLPARDRILQAVEVLKGLLGEEVADAVGNLVQDHLPPKPPTPAPVSPTEEERMERLAALIRRKKGIDKRVEESKGKVEKAKAKVVGEEEVLVKVERELAEVEEFIRAHREADERRERVRIEEARRAREPRCMELNESGGEGEAEEEEEEDEVNLEGGKKRKVVRKVRASRTGIFNENQMDELHEFLKRLAKENKLACMRSLELGGYEFRVCRYSGRSDCDAEWVIFMKPGMMKFLRRATF